MASVTPTAQTLVERLAATNAKGYGHAKLAKLSDAEIKALAQKMAPNAVLSGRPAEILVIMAAKRRTARLNSSADATRLAAVAEEEEAPAATPAMGAAFACATPTMRIVAWNALGLRAFSDPGLVHEVSELVEELGKADVIMICEVVPSTAVPVLTDLKERLQATTHGPWVVHVSGASTGGAKGGRSECHAFCIKAPMRANGARIQPHACGHKLDYAPFSLVVSGHEIAHARRRMELVLTSVHFPPAKRMNARNTQLAAFAKAYEHEADLRMSRPFTMRGAKDAGRSLAVHVLMGDFNCWPGTYLSDEWRTLIPRAASTTGGGGGLDNIVVNADALEVVNVSWDVLKLCTHANSRMGVKGLSDHDPVVLTIKNIQM